MNLGELNVPFIYQGEELIHPNPVKDGLILWYDFSGMHNSDDTKNVAQDLSGNGNHGTLQNFNYTEESGYQDNKLVFDGVDDFVMRPELDFEYDNFTVQINDEIYSYEGDTVTTYRPQNLQQQLDDAKAEFDALEVGGRNLHKNIKSASSFPHYHFNADISVIDDVDLPSNYFIRYDNYNITGVSNSFYFNSYASTKYTEDFRGEEVTLSFWMRGDAPFTLSGMDIGTNWTRIVYKIVWRTANHHLYISNDEDLNTIDVSSIQIEKGTIATDWTPAPEDTEAKITTLNPLHSYKIYNRPLSSEEIIRNYQIEKERFL